MGLRPFKLSLPLRDAELGFLPSHPESHTSTLTHTHTTNINSPVWCSPEQPYRRNHFPINNMMLSDPSGNSLRVLVQSCGSHFLCPHLTRGPSAWESSSTELLLIDGYTESLKRLKKTLLCALSQIAFPGRHLQKGKRNWEDL